MNEALFEQVADAIAAGATLADTLEVLGVTDGVFRRYMNTEPMRRIAIAHARADSTYVLADEIKGIADNDPDPQRARNRIEARKWLAARFNARQFGDKLALEVELKVDPAAAHQRALARIAAGRDIPLIINGTSESVSDVIGQDIALTQ